jgi:hypothetical protein
MEDSIINDLLSLLATMIAAFAAFTIFWVSQSIRRWNRGSVEGNPEKEGGTD